VSAIDFPDDPFIGQEFTAAGSTWVWTGAVWQVLRVAPIGPTGPQGAVGPTGATGSFPTLVDGGTPTTEFDL